MNLEIIGAESMGVRSLCCVVTLPSQRIVIDPGVSLGYLRHGLLPHPLQVAVGRGVREKILQVLGDATDVVFSHFHGDHVPLAEANPYQLSFAMLPPRFRAVRCWSKSEDGLPDRIRTRFRELAHLLGPNMEVAECLSVGPLSFSRAVPHGSGDAMMGTLMMTRVEMRGHAFVHASDIQLLDDATVDEVIHWQPSSLLAAGPPLYRKGLGQTERERAWDNAVRLAQSIDVVILDHHLLRSTEGAAWLDTLSKTVGKRVYCAADFMGSPRRLLEADRVRLYEEMPVPKDWHHRYAKGEADLNEYFDAACG